MNFANVSGRLGLHRLPHRNASTRGSQQNQGRARRYLAMLPVAIRIAGSTRQHVGLVRDLSLSGVFVYSDFEPTNGSVLELVLRASRAQSNPAQVRCLGKVVRIEKGIHGAAVGIGLAIQEYELAVGNKPPMRRTS